MRLNVIPHLIGTYSTARVAFTDIAINADYSTSPSQHDWPSWQHLIYPFELVDHTIREAAIRETPASSTDDLNRRLQYFHGQQTA
jgi:hypothetical protein